MLNIGPLVRRFGSIREIHESEREKYIRYLKNEMVTMNPGDNFLATVLSNLLGTLCIDTMNRNNKFNEGKTYERALNYKSYASFNDVNRNYLHMGRALSGVVLASDKGSDIYITTKYRRGDNDYTYQLYKVKFFDSYGKVKWILWYAPMKIESTPARTFTSVDNLNQAITDCVLIHPMPTYMGEYKAKNGHTVLARSWRVRTKEGELRVPVPIEEIFDVN